MEKIIFKDSPNTTTPLSANNLNTMQNNIESAINLTGISVTKIWEDSSVTSWHDANLEINVSSYDFLIIVTGQQSTIVPSYFDLYLTWNGYYSDISKDVITQRHIYRNGNDIRWGECYYRGINGSIGVDHADNVDFPKQVYGVKIGL